MTTPLSDCLGERRGEGLASINSSLTKSADLEDEQTEIAKAVYHESHVLVSASFRDSYLPV